MSPDSLVSNIDIELSLAPGLEVEFREPQYDDILALLLQGQVILEVVVLVSFCEIEALILGEPDLHAVSLGI